MLWPRRAPHYRRIARTIIGVCIAWLLALLLWSGFHARGDLSLLIALPVTAAGAIAALWLVHDQWANRYDRAIEIGYRLRDDDLLPAPRPELHVVELSSEDRQPY